MAFRCVFVAERFCRWPLLPISTPIGTRVVRGKDWFVPASLSLSLAHTHAHTHTHTFPALVGVITPGC